MPCAKEAARTLRGAKFLVLWPRNPGATSCRCLKGRRTIQGTVPSRGVDHQYLAVMFCFVGLNEGQCCVHGLGTFVKGQTGDFGRVPQSYIGLPSLSFWCPRFVRWEPSWQRFGRARRFIHEVCAMESQAKRARVE